MDNKSLNVYLSQSYRVSIPNDNYKMNTHYEMNHNMYTRSLTYANMVVSTQLSSSIGFAKEATNL